MMWIWYKGAQPYKLPASLLSCLFAKGKKEVFVLSLFLTVTPYPHLHPFLYCAFSSGLNTEGLYRVSGNKSEMESMQRQFEQGELFIITVLNQLFDL